MDLHQQQSHDIEFIQKNFMDFEFAGDEFDHPVCLWDKYWGSIKEDMVEAVERHQGPNGKHLRKYSIYVCYFNQNTYICM